MDTDKLIFGLIGIITVAISLFIILSSSSVTTTSNIVANELIGTNPNQRGSDSARLTMVEFSDFECPFCAKFSPILSALVEKYPKDLRIIYRHFPIPGHVGAIPAARASEAAALQGRFWKYHDELFMNRPNYASEDLLKYADTIGLDVERFKNDVNSKVVSSKVKTDSDYAGRIGVNSTPTIYLIYDGKIEKVNLGADDINKKITSILGDPRPVESSKSAEPDEPSESVKSSNSIQN